MKARELPAWVLPLAVVLGVLALGLVAYLSLRGRSDTPATRDIQVRPGMYDMRAELQKSRASSR